MATFTLGLVLILTSVSARRPLSKPVALLQLGTSQSRQDEIAGSANASAIDSGVCDVGGVAVCPYSGVSCAGNQCCPGSVETAGLNFVCPSANGNGPWAGQYPPRCQLLTKVEDCLAKSEPESISWVGCYTDHASRDLKEGPSSREDYTFGYGYTSSSCAEACKGYAIMALQSNGECRCGDGYATGPQYQKTADSECGESCVTEQHLMPRRYCGGMWRNAVYALGSQPPTLQTTASTTSTTTSSASASTSSNETVLQRCKFQARFCNSWASDTQPSSEYWELMTEECTPDGRGGAYMAIQPETSSGRLPRCGIDSPYFAVVKHFLDTDCTSEPESNFVVFTDGDCGSGCCDIATGSCEFHCRGYLSPV